MTRVRKAKIKFTPAQRDLLEALTVPGSCVQRYKRLLFQGEHYVGVVHPGTLAKLELLQFIDLTRNKKAWLLTDAARHYLADL